MKPITLYSNFTPSYRRPLKTQLLFAAKACLALFIFPQVMQASFIIQPTIEAEALGSSGGNSNNIVNQSGLSAPYINGVTNFQSYVTGVSHAQHSNASRWLTGFEMTTGTIDFDLGGPQEISHLAYWGAGGNSNGRVRDIELLISDTSTFASSVSIGTFTMPSTGNFGTIYDFGGKFSGEFVRMNVLSNYGATNHTIFGEVAFGSAVPEPSSATILLLMSGIGGILLQRRRMSLRNSTSNELST